MGGVGLEGGRSGADTATTDTAGRSDVGSRAGLGYHPGVDAFALLVIILVVVVIWRGPKTLPQIGAMLGRGVKSAREQVVDSKGDKGDGTAA